MLRGLKKHLRLPLSTSPKTSIARPRSPPTQPCWICSLPDELIAYIMVLATPLDRLVPVPSTAPWDPEPEFLTAVQLVCQRWRFVACSTPELWTFLHIKRGRPGGCQLHLERSGVLPLEVHLEANRHRDYDQIYSPSGLSQKSFRERLEKVDFMMLPHLCRMRKLLVDGIASSEIDATFKLISKDLVNLRELSVHCNTLDSVWYHLDLVAPRLLRMNIEVYELDWNHPPVAANLEELSVRSSMAPSKLIASVRAYPNLRELRIGSGVFYDGQLADHLGPIILERLEMLCLEGLSVSWLVRALGLLHTPQLKELKLAQKKRGSSAGDTAVNGSLPSLHLPALERLTLEMEPSVALEIAKQTPSIINLAFQRHDDGLSVGTNTALNSLFQHWRTLPESLPLETFSTKGVQPSTLLSLLVTKNEGVVPSLRKISIHWWDTYLSNSEESFWVDEETRRAVSDVVDLDVYGLWASAKSAREEVSSWEQQRAWRGEFIFYGSAPV